MKNSLYNYFFPRDDVPVEEEVPTEISRVTKIINDNPPVSIKPSWFMTERDRAYITGWLREDVSKDGAPMMADMIDLAVYSGLTIEKLLATTIDHHYNFGADKTSRFKKLPEEARIIFERVMWNPYTKGKMMLVPGNMLNPLGDRYFPISVDEFNEGWIQCIKKLGKEDDPSATYHTLQKSSANWLISVKKMPVDMVSSYLGHATIKETIDGLDIKAYNYKSEDFQKFFGYNDEED